MHPKIYAEKVSKMYAKRVQNETKMDAKINEKTMRFRNLRFLVFYKEYNVQIIFYMIRYAENRSKTDQKSMQKRG